VTRSEVRIGTKLVRAFLERIVEHLAEAGEVDLHEEAQCVIAARRAWNTRAGAPAPPPVVVN